MKKIFSLLIACSLSVLTCCPVQAAKVYSTYEEASVQATNDGYILFIYPGGWDRYGEKLCRKLISDTGVQAAAGKAALLTVPIYQNRKEANVATAKKIMGSLTYPHDMSDISYPALVFYDKGGRQYATLHGEKLMKASSKEVAELVRQRLVARKKQQTLLDKSGATQDVEEKARLVLSSARVGDVAWPNRVKETLRSIDPEDKYGCLAALDFGFGVRKDESMKDFLKRLETVLENPLLTNWQKQRACAAAIGHIRRSYGTMAGGSLITKYARKMQKLDPNSVLGLSAPVVMRDWVKRYRYGQGWSPEIIPGSEIPILMHGVPISKPGTYSVNFKITTGRDALHVKKIRLLDGSRCVAQDVTARSVTWSAAVQTFTLKVKKAVKNAVLEITLSNDAGHRSTWGDITVKSE